ncbi:uncharacterized protein LOC135483566 [Lineus longissimus]|uniref:uncharacterized protein LOC135483566 n=1 Tax=Lineus longissimus TaxID=88925 RepID=UPI002B4E6555
MEPIDPMDSYAHRRFPAFDKSILHDRSLPSSLRHSAPGLPFFEPQVEYPDTKRLLRHRPVTEALRLFWLTHGRDTKPNSKQRSNSCGVMERRLRQPPSQVRDRERELTSAKYYTAVTRRNPKPPKSPEYDALTRSFVPMPNLFDDDIERNYTRKSIDNWVNEVAKPVSPPVKVTVPYPCDTPEPTLKRKPNPLQFKKCMYYNANPPIPKRNYYINPEWISENLRSNLQFGTPPLNKLRVKPLR